MDNYWFKSLLFSAFLVAVFFVVPGSAAKMCYTKYNNNKTLDKTVNCTANTSLCYTKMMYTNSTKPDQNSIIRMCVMSNDANCKKTKCDDDGKGVNTCYSCCNDDLCNNKDSIMDKTTSGAIMMTPMTTVIISAVYMLIAYLLR